MKTAQELLVDFSDKVGLPVSGTMILLEREPENSDDPNWVVTGGGRSDSKNAEAVADMRKRYPKIDWSDVKEYDGKWRILRLLRSV
jgi:hypothetical protein